MNYRCLTCGFVQDFEPTEALVSEYHPWMAGRDPYECPACVQYLSKYGGRKNDNPAMPDITDPGVLVDESTIIDQLRELNDDFHALQTEDETKKKHKDLVKKYKNKKVFGFSPDDIKRIRRRIEDKEIRRLTR